MLSPVALTAVVIFCVVKPSASATEPVRVPPSIWILPVESKNALPPAFEICSNRLLRVVFSSTVNVMPLKLSS